MTRKTLYFLMALMFAVALWGCSAETPQSKKARARDKVALTVNGVPITEGMIERQITKMASQHSNRPDALRSEQMRDAVIQNLVTEVLVLEGAREAGIEVKDEQVAKKLSFIKQKMGDERFAAKLGKDGLTQEEFRQELMNNLLKQRFVNFLVPEDSVTVEDAKKVYTGSPIPMIHPAQLKVRFIQVSTFEEADKTLKNIKASGFEGVADEMQGKGGAMVSSYGWTSPGMYSKGISEGLRNLEAGQTGGPYEGKEGWFIFHVAEKKTERPKSFEEARDGIRMELLQNKKRAALAHWVGTKRSEAEIVEK